MFPICLIELMLHVEEPNPERPGDPERRQHNADERNESDQKTYPGRYRRNGGGRKMNTPFFPRSGVFGRTPVRDDEHCQRADNEHADRIPVDAVPQPSVPRPREIFFDGQHPYISGAAMVEIAAGGVVDVVIVPPFIVRSQRDQSAEYADDVVGALGFEKRAMRAIVEDNKCAHLKSCRRHRQRQREPIGILQAPVHCADQQKERTERIDHLPHAAVKIGALVLGDGASP